MKPKPKIVLSSLDAERIEKLLETLPADAPNRAALEAELARADVVDPKDVPPTVVTMNSTVRFRVASSDEEFQMTLVYPKDVDAGGNTVSVTAPVGSALLGLSQGDEIDWPKPGGGELRLRIEEITYQPERAGEYHR
ncbi:MAG TPA: nucleoside diphosphate kinase regulator [Steroidobacteraceae bacterium]|jgi:regulator of nucleoside diphosphate kinase|nr:nucleoside diphosphate kinase regulator [Steroidobacteraceae bacterium]